MDRRPLKVNLHTHTSYCDGKNSAEEMVLSAIAKGFDILGFSGHSYTPFDESYCMSLEDTLRYRREIAFLKEKYKREITILCGIEQDYYSNQPVSEYDYVIGSVHAFYKEQNGQRQYIYVDWDADTIRKAAEEFYAGDMLTLAEDYYHTVSDVVKRTGCQIIGHFDLLTKFNETESIPLFDETHPRYQNAALQALEKLLDADPIFEINTGAMAKGYRSRPYPSLLLLCRICQRGGRIMINSDSHSADTLDFAFEEARDLARQAGFTNVWIPNGKGDFIPQEI